MLIYVGKFSYSPYASNEIISVTFRDNLQVGDRVSVILEWTKDASGKEKANSSAHGTVNKVSLNGSGDRDIEMFFDEKEDTYYWYLIFVFIKTWRLLIQFSRYKGKVSGDRLTLVMLNKSGEEVAKNIQLQLTFI